MGSHSNPSPPQLPPGTWTDLSAHPALQQRTADAQPTTRDLRAGLRPAQPRLRRPRRPPTTPTATKPSRDREAALALGIRVAVHDSRQNDPNPVIWQAGQDYRAADAIHAARPQPTRHPPGPGTARPRTLTTTRTSTKEHS